MSDTTTAKAPTDKAPHPKTVAATTAEAKAQATKARDDLADTLDGLEAKLNLPKNAAAAYRRNPLPFIIGGVVVAGAIVGLVIWAIVRDE
jgi:hypothetical protein